MTAAPGEALLARLDDLARFTDEPGALTRLYLSPAHKAATRQVAAWMEEAGMAAAVDPVGNVAGRYEGERPGLPAVLLGSHIDTVRNAGRYDGNLGVLAAIQAVAELNAKAERLPFAIEVLAFGDEEGVRFPTALAGSRAVAGTLRPRHPRRPRRGRRDRSRRPLGVRLRPGRHSRDRAPARPGPRLCRGPHRAGPGPRGRGPAGRRRHRDQRGEPLQGRGHGRGGPRRHGADGPAQGRARRRGRDGAGRRAPRFGDTRPGRHRRPARGGTRRGQRHPGFGPLHDRPARA